MISTDILTGVPGTKVLPTTPNSSGRLVFRCAPVRDDLGDAPREHHRAQGDDDGGHLELRDEEGVYRADAGGARHGRR